MVPDMIDESRLDWRVPPWGRSLHHVARRLLADGWRDRVRARKAGGYSYRPISTIPLRILFVAADDVLMLDADDRWRLTAGQWAVAVEEAFHGGCDWGIPGVLELWAALMRYQPSDEDWIDRFHPLSAGDVVAVHDVRYVFLAPGWVLWEGR
jgi:hypothetical protein